MTEPLAAIASTPLPEIALRDIDDLAAFLRTVRAPLDRYLADCKALRTEDGRAAVSLAMDLIEGGGPDPVPALPLLGMAYRVYDPGPFALNVLRVGARVWANGGNSDRPHMPHYAPRGTDWAGRIVSNVRGLSTAVLDPASYRITTEEELADIAVTVRFAVRAAFSDKGLSVLKFERIKEGWHSGEQQTQYSNKRFRELVRTRPKDHDRILAYIDDRGAPKGTSGVEDLRAWLDSEMAKPLASGWL